MVLRWSSFLPLLMLAACGGGEETNAAGTASTGSGGAGGQEPFDPPAPDAWEPNKGPGGPAVAFEEAELYTNCAFIHGGVDDVDHHNLVMMYDGYLLLPWSPEYGTGGLTFFDVSDPCQPVAVGSGHTEVMRESHSIGFSAHDGRWMVMDGMTMPFSPDTGGIMFWDVSDPTAPVAGASLDFAGFFYPDAYARVTLSVFWQAPYVYVGGADNGVFIVDATDPKAPVLVSQYLVEPTMRVGQVQVVGNLLVLTTAEGPRTVLLDISDPANPQPIPGGDFDATDELGDPRDAYFTTTTNGHLYYANKDGGGGLIVWDIRDPSQPAFAGQHIDEGNGGYVFLQENFAFVGNSDFASILDVSDLSAITELTRLDMTGDLDTITPVGNVAVLSVDDSSEPDKSSAITPWRTEVDVTPPRVTWVWPAAGATGLPVTSRFGVTFSELVDVRSAFVGSVRLYDTATGAAVRGYVSAQESIVNFWPEKPLAPSTEYRLEILAGGVVDYNGNAVTEPFEATFTTGG